MVYIHEPYFSSLLSGSLSTVLEFCDHKNVELHWLIHSFIWLLICVRHCIRPYAKINKTKSFLMELIVGKKDEMLNRKT